MKLLIDGHAFINVAINVTKLMADKDKRTGISYYVNDLFKEDSFILKSHIKIIFNNFCITYLNSLIAPIGNSLDSVHFVMDSISWRTKYIQQYFSESTDEITNEFQYKGTRLKDPMHKLFFEYFINEILPDLNSKCLLNFHRINGLEGDDLIAKLCEIINSDIIIFSVDYDLKQLVSSKDKNILLLLPKKGKSSKQICTPPILFNKSNSSDDFFSLDDSMFEKSIQKIISNYNNKDFIESKTDASEELLSKILMGDKSDNIKKIKGLTPLKSKKIISSVFNKYKDNLIEYLDTLNEEFLFYILQEISILNKIKDETREKEILNNIIFNIKIIRLSTNMFPDYIQKSLDEHFNDLVFTKFNQKALLTLKK
jgi:5'-3' exonuclease